jgi:hypothetical protein
MAESTAFPTTTGETSDVEYPSIPYDYESVFEQASESPHSSDVNVSRADTNDWSVIHSMCKPVPASEQELPMTTSMNMHAQRWNIYSHEAIAELERNKFMQSLQSSFEFPSIVNMFPSVDQSFVSSTVFKLDTVELSSSQHLKHSASPVTFDRSAWITVAKRLDNMDWSSKQEAQRSYALEKWKAIIQVSPSSFSLGRLLLADILKLHDDRQIVNTLQDTFALKATKTLIKRSSYISRFISWCITKSVPPFPVQEQQAYAFLYDCNWQAASFGNSFREALNFAGHVAGLDGAAEAAKSPRIAGFCGRMMLTKRKRIPAQVLKVKQVSQLEKIVLDDTVDIQDRVFCGHCLFVLFARARWTDSQGVERLTLDVSPDGSGFLEADTYCSKTSNTVQKRRTMLPMTCILKGLHSNEWAKTWLGLRVSAGLQEPSRHVPMLPMVNSQGGFGTLPLSPSQASQWLRNILLAVGYAKGEVERISSHSLKATTLSWAAKGGMSQDLRSILGYHVTQSSSVLHYSRDEQAEPLRQLGRIIDDIISGALDPDSTRSGYWSKPSVKLLGPTSKCKAAPSDPANVDDPLNSSCAYVSGSSSEDSSSSESQRSVDWSDEERLAVSNTATITDREWKRKRGAMRNTKHGFAVHLQWKTLHVVDSSTVKLSCGRRLSPLYKLFKDLPSFSYSKCKVCFDD